MAKLPKTLLPVTIIKIFLRPCFFKHLDPRRPAPGANKLDPACYNANGL